MSIEKFLQNQTTKPKHVTPNRDTSHKGPGILMIEPTMSKDTTSERCQEIFTNQNTKPQQATSNTDTSDKGPEIMMIGSWMFRDIIPQRFSQKTMKKLMPEPKSLTSAIKTLKEIQVQPKKLILLTGSNDVSNRRINLLTTLSLLSELITTLKDKDYNEIFISEILPRYDDYEYMRRRDIFNQHLKTIVQNTPFKIIIQHHFVASDFVDGVHLTYKGTAKLVCSIKDQIGERQAQYNYDKDIEQRHRSDPRNPTPVEETKTNTDQDTETQIIDTKDMIDRATNKQQLNPKDRAKYVLEQLMIELSL
ncbi:hypothetical protein LOTGIDRAFT_175540 [Lottia gigantea]|uniref:SGNH hydrolase-type esterase domain-containing protein n=1 Tax=Lottia gigantea TaxID=225164 RepID=V3ZQ09_LOTGI|nr:hypothetical protein LOTGIDRAFT_175540 [Lottia gigantea]ESO93473.1 hypothetical protein LOTGIDRAFT_175540 [Lottia gigantea]